MARGGYRKPNNPAPVSGPGALSRRTDGGPTQGAKYMSGGQYGEGKQLQELQKSAPMAASQQPRMASSAGAMPANMPPIVPLTAMTQRPDEPITAGLPIGPGPGPEILGTQTRPASLSETLSQIVQHDTTGEVVELYNYLISRGM